MNKRQDTRNCIRPRNQPVLKLNIFAYTRRLGPVIVEYTVVIESDTVLQVHPVGFASYK